MYYFTPNSKEKLILDLHGINAIKFGKFKLKSGIISPYYIDLRSLVYYPYLLELTADVFWEVLQILNFDVVVGVPYTAIPIATAIGLKHNQSMVFVRKERKNYGTGKLIEGDFHQGQRALIIDDVITNGASKLETIQVLKSAGLNVEDVVVLLDRSQGGTDILKEKGYRCHSIFTITEIFEVLLIYKRVDKEIVDRCIQFTNETREFFKKAN